MNHEQKIVNAIRARDEAHERFNHVRRTADDMAKHVAAADKDLARQLKNVVGPNTIFWYAGREFVARSVEHSGIETLWLEVKDSDIRVFREPANKRALHAKAVD